MAPPRVRGRGTRRRASTDARCPPFLQLLTPLAALARAGATPATLARSTGLGVAIGLCPLLGAPFPLCLLACVVARLLSLPLSPPATLLGNAASLPGELALLVPFIRAGAWVAGVPAPALSPAALREALWRDPRSLARPLAGALAVWAASVPIVTAAVAAALRPAVAALSARASPPPRATPDVEASAETAPLRVR